MNRGHHLVRRLVLALPRGRSGVLPNQYLEIAIAEGIIGADGADVPLANVQPASLDLRLGPVAYELRCSFLPTTQTVQGRLNGSNLVVDKFDLGGNGAVLSAGRPYLIPLKEHLALPKNVRAKANPKSSTGRADVFTRVITDNSVRFDDVAAGYNGGLFLEVVPLSFPVRIREDLSLNQLRLSVGRAELNDEEIFAFHARQPILFTPRAEVAPKKLTLSGGLFLGLDLRANRDGVGYSARMSPPILDLTQVGTADPRDYWEHVEPESEPRIVLEPKRFYLLMSYEAVTIPPTLAAEMTAYDPTSGELRTHYAGFFDPGFGYDEAARFCGSTAALEVRAHDVPFMVEHRQPVCKLTFERMFEPPTLLYGAGIGSNYQQQTETLGKHFRLSAPDVAAKPRKRTAMLTAGQLELPTPGP